MTTRRQRGAAGRDGMQLLRMVYDSYSAFLPGIMRLGRAGATRPFCPVAYQHQRNIVGDSSQLPMNYGRASNIILKGVSVARLTERNPPAVMTSRSLVSPACAPRAAPTSCDNEVGMHTIVEAA